MSIYLKNIIKKKLEDKYKIDFNELENISKSIKNKYFVDKKIKLLFEIYIVNNGNDDFITTKCLKRFKFIEDKEYSYISDNDLYKNIEKAYELWFVLYDYMSLEILWNKEITKKFDKDYQLLKKIAEIYLRETNNLIKELEEYEINKKIK